eukprot:7638305-Karenia_brevis.AAC.1
MHPKCPPTHLALYEDGAGVSLSNGLRSWGLINGKWQFTTPYLLVHLHWKGETDANGEPLSPWTVLKQVTGPDPPVGERLLSHPQ